MPGPRCYDEAFDAAGQPRGAYVGMARRVGWNPLRPGPRITDQLRHRPLGDDAIILPFPLVIDDNEYRSIIHNGLDQRARALQHLFADLVLGDATVLRAGLGLTRELLDSVLADEGTSLPDLRRQWAGAEREAIRFVYGPDLVRAPTGRWMVLEDNVGCVGGSADGYFVTDRYRAAAGLHRDPEYSEPDLARAIQRWLHRLDAVAGDVLATLGSDTTCDRPQAPRVRENDRRRAILDGLGVIVTDRPRLPGGPGKAPLAVLNFAVDTQLAEAFTVHRIPLLNAPGTGILGNKALLPFLDDIIRLFTGHEPILRTPPTRLLTDGTLPPDPHAWVVKSATGCQGTEVHILSGQPRARLADVERLLRAQRSPTAMVAQRHVPLSRLSPDGRDAYRIEIRPVTYLLGWQDIYISRQPVGKAVSINETQQLTNISQGAYYLPVLRERCTIANDVGPSQHPYRSMREHGHGETTDGQHGLSATTRCAPAPN